MCLAIPARVTALEAGDMAVVALEGVKKRISVTLAKEGVVYPQPDPTPGVTDPAGWRTGKADPDDASADALRVAAPEARSELLEPVPLD